MKRNRVLKITAVFLTLNLLFEILFPTVSMALTSGPKSPEFSTFTPVSSSNMVNEFSGDFSYNLPVIEIPGPDGGGYALSLSYQSGVSMEQEASWVGYGFNLSPGFISRSKRGFPDDYSKKEVEYFNKTVPNWTMHLGIGMNIELFSKDMTIGVTTGLTFNNYSGWKQQAGMSFGMSSDKVSGNVGLSFSPGEDPTADFSISVTTNLYGKLFKNRENVKKKIMADEGLLKQVAEKKLTTEQHKAIAEGVMHKSRMTYGSSTFASHSSTFNVPKYFGIGVNLRFGIGAAPSPTPVTPFDFSGVGSFNIQKTKNRETKDVFGYMYNGEAEDEKEYIMDYFSEGGQPFSTSAKYMNVPQSNYDVFNVNIEGLAGGFRPFNESVGHYRPNQVYSHNMNFSIGVDLELGTYTAIGITFGTGYGNTEIEGWTVLKNKGSFSDNNQFVFNSDLASNIAYTQNTDIEEGIATFAGAKAKSFSSLTDVKTSTFVKEEYEDNDAKMLKGFVVNNPSGVTYEFLENIKTRNEVNVSVNSNTNIINNYITIPEDDVIDNNFEVQINKFKTCTGQKAAAAYANDFLITCIKNSNYVDVTEDFGGVTGPDSKDFGGWTKFSYKTKYGGTGDWYKYKSPYNGLYFERNSYSDERDDMGSMAIGEKEVKYLESIETKTHYAFFVTNKSTYTDFTKYLQPLVNAGLLSDATKWTFLNGSQKQRLDGFSAQNNYGRGNQELEYLEKIVLISKTRPLVPLKTVNFAYDWSLVPNVANNKNTDYSVTNDNSSEPNESGKLTLKKVWFEYEGVCPVKISPYVFEYYYPDITASDNLQLQELYAEYTQIPKEKQNPAYSAFSLDQWGDIQKYGKERKAKDIPWAYQGRDKLNVFSSQASEDWKNNLTVEENFDPAAYNLKQIILPSGGKILVQYEKNDYNKVQNRDVMAMASLIEMQDDKTFIVNCDDLGADPFNRGEVDKLVEKIKTYFSTKRDDGSDEKKLFYKILFSLVESGNLDYGKSEYISGWANIEIEQVSPYALPNGAFAISIGIARESSGEGVGAFNSVPYEACKRFFLTRRQGIVLDNPDPTMQDIGKEDSLTNIAEKGGSDEDESSALKDNLIDGIRSKFDIIQGGTDQLSAFIKSISGVFLGGAISAPRSFFKLPMLGNKKGGGVRVKRLLLYDEGIAYGNNSGHEIGSVYGQEYFYTLEDGRTSSGVATNEPGTAQDENPLITFLPKKEQSWYRKLTAGTDREQFEGPLGKSLLPPPTIGYSRVVINSIANNAKTEAGVYTKNTVGYTVKEFYTVKDYPFDKVYTEVGCEGAVSTRDFTGSAWQHTELSEHSIILPIYTDLINIDLKQIYGSQGYRFILTDMHGKIKSEKNYANRYIAPVNQTDIVADYQNIVSSKNYEYFEPGEKIRLWDGKQEHFEVPGREIDVVQERKKTVDFNFNFELAIDIGFGTLVTPPIYVTFSPSISLQDHFACAHVTSKVLRYPTFLKSVKTSEGGVTTVTENLVCDYYTGSPIATSTKDEYNNDIYSYSIPAAWIYSQLGPKSSSETNENNLTQMAANITTLGNVPDLSWLTFDDANKTVTLNPGNVLSLNADFLSMYSDWNNSSLSNYFDGVTLSGQLESTLTSKLRSLGSYVYKNNNILSNSSSDLKTAGTFTPDPFVWKTDFIYDGTAFPAQSQNWIAAAKTTIYSPNGVPVEEEDAFGFKSAVVYGKNYGNMLPTMVGKNTSLNQLFFEDFETSIENVSGHSGEGCKLVLTDYDVPYPVCNSIINSNKDILMRFWVRPQSFYQASEISVSYNDGNSRTLYPAKIAQTGEWQLYSISIPENSITGTLTDIKINAQNCYIDDVRIQPSDAQTTCYVYDSKSFKPVVQFDDQHFGLYYQYNAEGKLVRKIIETEKYGKATVQENQYNTPKRGLRE